MRILSVELQNIKSYGEPTRIDFSSGLNAVCGLNGSGKTTVVEAIGFALFDYLPYNRDAFLREGQRNGTIRVLIQGGDGREYEVVRKLGSGSQYYVVDVETATRLAERGPSVLEWVKSEALGIEGQADLPTLFKNAVGVPQGLMTSDFLGNASTRKTVFDPLLRVEEYRDAFEHLRETMSYLRERTSTVNTEIARLEAETDRIPGLQDELAQLREKAAASAGLLARLDHFLEDVERQKRELDSARSKLDTLEGDLRESTYQEQRLADALKLQQRQLESAQAAHRAVVSAEPGYRLVHEALRRLTGLDARRAQRDGLRASLAKVQGQLDGTRRQVELLETEIAGARDASAAAEALKQDVARQTELELEQHQLVATLKTVGDLERRAQVLEGEIASLLDHSADLERRINDAKASRETAAGLSKAQEALAGYASELAQLEPLRAQLAHVTEEGKGLKEIAVKLTGDTRLRQGIAQELEQLLPVVNGLETARTQLDSVRDERVELKAAADYRRVARASLQRRQCPLLEVQCPVVTSNASVLGRLDEHAGDVDGRLRELDATLAALGRDIASAEKAAAEAQRLQVRIAQLDGSEERLKEIQIRLKSCLARHGEVSQLLARENELRASYDSARQEVQRLQAAHDLGQIHAELESRLEDDVQRLHGLREEQRRVQDERSALATLRGRLAELASELGELKDPRARQAALRATAARLPDLESRLEREMARRETEEEAHGELQEGLLPFETLDQEIAEQRAVEDTHRPAYEAYLKNQQEAQSVREREQGVKEADRELRAARQRTHAIAVEREAAAALYSAEEHTRLIEECKSTGEQLASERTNHVHLERDRKAKEEDLAYLLRQRQKLLDRQTDRHELAGTVRALTFIRETIKSAGPAVTETLLAHISQGANDIFSEIMDDHAVELRWDRDYEVVLQRGPEIRKFGQLSGGEQMSAALAVRLALLKEMSDVDFAFFDEPTQNMDEERRTNLADQIREVRGFDQLIVISHDDTFEHHTDNLIRLQKIHEETRLDTA